MFEKCIKCHRIGESCVPNLMLLPFANLLQWCDKRQAHLGWSNKTLADKSTVPLGTISRIKAGEEDCRYSTIRSILITLIGGTKDEFSCTEMVERELQQKEQLEQQTAKLTETVAENKALKEQLDKIDDLHRKDMRTMREEYHKQIDFLTEEIKFLRSIHTKQE